MAAQAAIAEVKPEAEKFVPALYPPLSEAMTAAQPRFDEGDYHAALAAAKNLPAHGPGGHEGRPGEEGGADRAVE